MLGGGGEVEAGEGQIGRTEGTAVRRDTRGHVGLCVSVSAACLARRGRGG